MLDRYKLAAEIREFLLDRDGRTAAELADGLVDMFVAWCRELHGEQPTKE
jgi:hypothetical protein